MKIQSEKLAALLNEHTLPLEAISNDAWSFKSVPSKWSKKEILGHLIDSAQNNIQRFIRGQYETEANIFYDQNQWVILNNYQKSDIKELLILWKSLNERIIIIWENMNEATLNKKCNIQNERVTVEWLMNDYIHHLSRHLNQIKN